MMRHHDHQGRHEGATDQEMLQRSVESCATRFNDAFWDFFDTEVSSTLPSDPVIADLGCGPGLFLQALRQRLPNALLHGYDTTAAMLDHARSLEYTGRPPDFAVCDLPEDKVPLADGSVHLVTMTAVLHHVPDPLAALADVRRLLAHGGLFLLSEWERVPLAEYMARRAEQSEEVGPTDNRRLFEHYSIVNRFSAEDWRWMLEQEGLILQRQRELGDHFLALLAQAT